MRSIKNQAAFASTGARSAKRSLGPLFSASRQPVGFEPLRSEDRDVLEAAIEYSDVVEPGSPRLQDVLRVHRDRPLNTAAAPIEGEVSAGKNTYTYDAHTYHTKVPPQGIVSVISGYLPSGGIVLDPFSGSGMTGVAARIAGVDAVLNDLSPAAAFISNRFTRSVDPDQFASVTHEVANRLSSLEESLYRTDCRECGKETRALYFIWSYVVACTGCEHRFVLWDHCRKYGRTVREHKILTEFPCPQCGTQLKKSRLPRWEAVPVKVAYKCCGSRQQEVIHDLHAEDRALISRLGAERDQLAAWYPRVPLPDGDNLCQPKRHGIDSVDKFYTDRGLIAFSQLWTSALSVSDVELRLHTVFALTSLYRRITRMSEFRFWGGSGNTAHFNIPYIFEETNVFESFRRKALTIEDHLRTTAREYSGRCVSRIGSATDLSDVPSRSIDLVFTDPPFGGNINYSEMNILWESWLGRRTDDREEAIMNRHQSKGIREYEALMAGSFAECARVLKSGAWMVVVFQNSAGSVWTALQNAIATAGFRIERVDIFDKKHGTFKQFVSVNSVGYDLMLHCRLDTSTQDDAPTPEVRDGSRGVREALLESVRAFLSARDLSVYRRDFAHVNRESELDYMRLFSEWLAGQVSTRGEAADFRDFRRAVAHALSDATDSL